MGTVWRASQTEPMRREVALKIVKLGMDTREVIVRFEAERQALALMDHPGIAKVLDGGATSTGRPYFVMELVAGAPITKFCDEQRLDLRARLELFREVCDAVQHAHHKGVIHRDLKPSNVLVAPGEHGPASKVIDFGIAKATSAQLTEATMQTELGQIVGTPEYMAPEQSLGDGTDVDTRADVYSLGVMLYELLTGTKTFDVRRALQIGFDELLRQIREVDPQKPSTRVSSLGETATAVADSRGADGTTLSRHLRGDLDWVVMRALEKDRERRYDTPAALAEDIRRCLANEPVEAAPPSASYRLRKFVARRKKLVAAAALVLVLLVGGLAETGYGLWKAVRANSDLDVALDEKQEALERETDQRRIAEANEERALQAESDAQRELSRAKEVTRVVRSMIEGAQPQVALGRDASLLRGIADDTAVRLANGEIEDPFVAAELDEILGLTYISLSEYDASHFHYTRAEAFYENECGADDRRTLGARRCLATLLAATNDFETLLDVGTVLLDDVRRVLGEETNDRAMIAMIMGQAATVTGRFELADQFLAEAIAISSRVNGEDAHETSEALRHLSWLRRSQSRFEESLALTNDLLAQLERLGTDPNDPKWIDLQHDKLVTVSMLGRVGEAVDLASGVYEASSRIFGPEHHKSIVARSDLVTALREAGRVDDALRLCQESVDWHTRVKGPEDPQTLYDRYALALTKFTAGDHAGSRADIDEILPLAREHGMGTEAGQILKFLNFAAIVARQTGDGALSEELQLEAIERMIELWGIESRDTLGAITNLGWLFLQTGRPPQALEQFERSLPVKLRILGPTHRFTRAALAGVANAKRALGDRDGAIGAAQQLRAAHLQLVDEDPRNLQSLHELVRSLLSDPLAEMRDAELAVQFSELAVEVTERADADSLGFLATAYWNSDRPRDALHTATELLEKLEPGTAYHRQVERSKALYEQRVAELDAAEGDQEE